MKKLLILAVVACLLLSACGTWMDGKYVSVTPHTAQLSDNSGDITWISDEEQLYQAIWAMVQQGQSSDLFFIRDYGKDSVADDVLRAHYRLKSSDPIGAYALKTVTYETGINGGRSTLAVNVEYTHSRTEILRMRKVRGAVNAKALVQSALEKVSTDLVFYVENYEATDFAQIVESYALEHPELVIEIPQVSVALYPETGGKERVVELKFSYQTSRDVLRNMQSNVERVFESAALYVDADESDREQLSHLYVFLMERFNYHYETSITPAYSLLRHGVGDSKAFAVVFAAMCRQVGLDCVTVSGTRYGEPWFWNIVCDDGIYYHVDLLKCVQSGGFREHSDSEMSGYVWDYSAYPVCSQTRWPEETTETTLPQTPDQTDLTDTTVAPEEMTANSTGE